MTITRVMLAAAAVAVACSSPQPTPAPQPAAPSPTAPSANLPSRGGAPTLPTAPVGPPGQGADTTGGRGGFPGLANGPRPYNRVITPDAKTRTGMFKVHRVGDRLYFEIPAKELNKDKLVVGRFARAAAGNQTPGPTGGFGEYAGDEFGERTLRWERNGNRVVLRSTSFGITADTALSVYRSVQNSNYGPIIAVFNVDSVWPGQRARSST